MTHQLNLSLEAGRISNVINGKTFAIIGASQMRTLTIWQEGNCYLKQLFYTCSKALQLEAFHFLESIQCLRDGKELCKTALGVKNGIDASQTGESNVTFVITGDHLLKTGGCDQICMDLSKLQDGERIP